MKLKKLLTFIAFLTVNLIFSQVNENKEIGWFGNAYYFNNNGVNSEADWNGIHNIQKPILDGDHYVWRWTLELIEGRSFVFRDGSGSPWHTWSAWTKEGDAFINNQIVKEDGQDNFRVASGGTYEVILKIHKDTNSYTAIIRSQTKSSGVFYVDFGKHDGVNGNETLSPDLRNNYWNNVDNPYTMQEIVDLVDNQNNPTIISISIDTNFNYNGIFNGGLLEPNESYLDDFAVNTATQDYFFTQSSASFTISNLHPNTAFDLSFFATRKTTGTRITKYTLEGKEVSEGLLQTSGSAIGEEGYDGNNNTILKMGSVYPNEQGKIKVTVSVESGGFAYLGALKIEKLNNEYFLDLGTDNQSNGVATTNPDSNSNYWNNITNSTAGSIYSLVNSKNLSSTLELKLNSSFGTNGLAGGGGLLESNSDLLGDLAVNSATQDYFFSTSSPIFSLLKLNTESAFQLQFFGSRNTTNERITTIEIDGDAVVYTGDYQTSGADIGGAGYNGNNSVILKSDKIYPNTDGSIKVTMSPKAGGFAYINALKIIEETPLTFFNDEPCVQDPLKIAVMGSSVADGYGADNSQGYAYQYTKLLEERHTAGVGEDWDIVNISIGGNTTTDVMNRWDRDLLSQCSSYVVIGLSLGNEGILGDAQAAFNSFKTNMEQIILNARDVGIEPIIANCYANGNFDNSHYLVTKEMNDLIHQWDVSSINLLGANDNGQGKWADGYTMDSAHPNTAGHLEMSYSLVPSLFDALNQGKAIPVKFDKATSLSFESGSYLNKSLRIDPEETMHSFTVSFDLKTMESGLITLIDNSANDSYLRISENGKLVYSSPFNQVISSEEVINDDSWHKLSLTHYYAQGFTKLYIDGQLIGELSEKVIPKSFVFSPDSTNAFSMKELMIHRAGMNDYEIDKINSNMLLKSSLEIYAPLDGEDVDSEIAVDSNLAMSLNTIFIEDDSYIATDLDLDGVLDTIDDCLNTDPGVSVGANGCVVFDINGADFEILASDLSCNSSINGSIDITIKNVSEVIDVMIDNQSVGLLNSQNNYHINLTDLSAGTYNLCFNVADFNYTQCFQVVLNEPEPITAYSSYDAENQILELELKGSNEYIIQLNDKQFKTTNSNIDLNLEKGLNKIIVYTDQDCQGYYEKEVFVSDEAKVFPNPVRSFTQLYVGGSSPEVNVVISNINGKVFFNKEIQVPNDRMIDFNFSEYKSGIYIMNVTGTSIQKSFKLIKNQ
ncbi:MAG: T9SS type A sorting domain-containing protein [Oceanospirillaceae bacterium]|nr:T9SS type A sorting domain-containing protein [Oceanospirillaceae bacterium]